MHLVSTDTNKGLKLRVHPSPSKCALFFVTPAPAAFSLLPTACTHPCSISVVFGSLSNHFVVCLLIFLRTGFVFLEKFFMLLLGDFSGWKEKNTNIIMLYSNEKPSAKTEGTK